MKRIIVKPSFIQTSARCKGFHKRKAYRKITRARFESLEGIKWKNLLARLENR